MASTVGRKEKKKLWMAWEQARCPSQGGDRDSHAPNSFDWSRQGLSFPFFDFPSCALDAMEEKLNGMVVIYGTSFGIMISARQPTWGVCQLCQNAKLSTL